MLDRIYLTISLSHSFSSLHLAALLSQYTVEPLSSIQHSYLRYSILIFDFLHFSWLLLSYILPSVLSHRFPFPLSLSLSHFLFSVAVISFYPYDALIVDDKVSEDMLRLVVEEAQRSVTGIDTGEGRMIKAVLDMQDTEVGVWVSLCIACKLRWIGTGTFWDRIRRWGWYVHTDNFFYIEFNTIWLSVTFKL